MTTSTQSILLRLHRLEARLDWLESALDAAGVLTPAQSPLPAASGIEPPTESTPHTPAAGTLAPVSLGAASMAGPGHLAVSAPRPIHAESLDRQDHDADIDSPGLERLIGGRWYAILGGLVVIIGVAFFYQYALQQGWFRILPDWCKCAGGAAFGAALLIAAEFTRRRVNAWAAVGLSTAGIGAMYVSTYAAYSRYDLVAAPAAFVLLSLCAAAGLVFAARARLVAVALASLAGGYLTPFLLHESGSTSVLPPYWLMLLLVGLGLSARLGGSFRLARGFAVTMTLLLGAGWTIADGDDFPLLALTFLSLTWVGLHAELWWSSTHPGPARHARRSAGWERWSPVISSFMMTTWATGLGVLLAQDWLGIPDWLPPAAGAGVTAMISMVLAGNLRLLRDAPATPAERLGAGLCIQSGALIIAALALALSGWMEVIAWLSMGLSAVVAGRWLDARPLRVYGAVLLSIATARLLVFDSHSIALTSPIASAANGVVLSRWMLLILAAALAWLAAAVLAAVESPRADDEPAPPARFRTPPALLAFFGVALLMIAFLHTRAQPAAITIAWMVIAAILAPLSPLLRSTGRTRLSARLALTPLASVPALLAIIPWSYAFIVPGWSTFNDPPALHRGLLLITLLAAGLAVVAHLATAPLRGHEDPDLRGRRTIIVGGSLALGAVLIFTATSFEAARVAGLLFTDRTSQLAAVSLWWGVFSIALLVIGFIPAIAGPHGDDSPRGTLGRLPRQAGLALLGLATAKALFIDTAQVSLGWRVISVLGLGLLMLGVGVVYARLSSGSRPTPV